MNRDLLVACSTFPEMETARRIAHQLVTEKLAACVNLVPAVESIYHWQGKIENAAEVLAFFKTTVRRYPAFEEKLKGLHPYDVPEILCFGIEGGFQEYLDWVVAGCSPG